MTGAESQDGIEEMIEFCRRGCPTSARGLYRDMRYLHSLSESDELARDPEGPFSGTRSLPCKFLHASGGGWKAGSRSPRQSAAFSRSTSASTAYR